jgi:hypothetical protein
MPFLLYVYLEKIWLSMRFSRRKIVIQVHLTESGPQGKRDYTLHHVADPDDVCPDPDLTFQIG